MAKAGDPPGSPARPEASRAPGLPPGTASPDSSFLPGWLGIVPYFISAIFFLSAFFAVFSPFPLLLLGFRSRRKSWLLLAILTNLLIVFLAGGLLSALAYGVFVVSTVVVLLLWLSRGYAIETSAGAALLAMALSAVGVLLVHSVLIHQAPGAVLQQAVGALSDYMAQTVATGPEGLKTGLLNGMTPEEFKQNMINELPAAFAIFSLLLVAVNIVMLLRVNPGGLRQRLRLDAFYLRRWKAPEFLVWPTIAAGFLVVVDFGQLSIVGLNVFKFLMAVYGLQGLSILSFFFDVWNVRGLFRLLGTAFAVLLMMPLLLSLGFFDLWFDFRSKFRTS